MAAAAEGCAAIVAGEVAAAAEGCAAIVAGEAAAVRGARQLRWGWRRRWLLEWVPAGGVGLWHTRGRKE